MNGLIDPRKFNKCVNTMRSFFLNKGFTEVHTQSALSILAACEDPTTISTYQYNGKVWPLPQTGQMWLEQVLLKDPSLNGVFCVSTSYRNEPNPIKGRHDLIFPMVEFESKGNMSALQRLEIELLDYMGFNKNNTQYTFANYLTMSRHYKTKELTHEYEMRLSEEFGKVFFLKNFPFYTSPFWNMKANFSTGIANKIDVIMHGMETIGSAERSTDPNVMRKMFHTISDGQYRDILYAQFSKKRVDKELEEFLSMDFFERYGGGIGVTRMIRAMEMSNLL